MPPRQPVLLMRAPRWASRPALGGPRLPRLANVPRVPQRDLFADFARMRREMDSMLGDCLGRAPGTCHGATTGFSPNVDVYYCGEPQRAVVKVDLAGVALSEIGIEVSGRHLAIVGERPVQETEGRVYQQVEIPTGPFRRVIELQVEVDAERASATYEDGVLRIELPLRDPDETTRRVPIGREADGGLAGPRGRRRAARRPRTRSAPASRCRRRCRCCRCATSVTFPETLNPLAVGQERSIQLVNDVLGGQPDAGHGRLPRPRERAARARATSTTSASSASSPGWSRSPTARCGSSSRACSGSGSAPTSAESPTWSPGSTELPDVSKPSAELEALTRNVQQTFSEIVEQIPYLPEELRLAVANIDDPAALGHLIAGSLRIATEEKQKLLEEVDVAKRLRHLSRILARELEVVQLGTQIQTQVQSEDRQRPARVLPAPAAESDPGGARRGGRAAGRSQRTARADRGREAARAGAESGRARALAAGETAAGGRRARRHPHLPGVADRAAVVGRDRGQPRHRPRPQGARRRPLRPRKGQGPDPRVPRGAQAQPRLAGPDPLLRRPARGRQDQPRPLDRHARSAASSSGSRSAASATRRRSAATAAPTSGPCPGRSSAPCATPAPATRSS